MTDRRRERSVFANPVLIGAVTVLVGIVAVFLAYNANSGLPFVPKYTLRVDVRDANELTNGAEVHMGGALVGSVSSISAARDAVGRPIAVLTLALDKRIEPLSVDSSFIIRLKGAIGLKYLDVIPGRSPRTLLDGAAVPVDQTAATVDLDQVLSTYDPLTRLGVRATTAGYATGLTGRGADLNDAIRAFVPLFGDLRPVMRNLSSPRTDLAGFFHGLESFAGAAAPVARDQADLYAHLDTTFTALASVAVPFLQDWISQTPPTEATVIAQSPTIRPFVTDTAALFAELKPGFATLPQSSPVLADAFAAGTRNLPATIGLDQRLVSLSRTLERYGQTDAVLQGLDRGAGKPPGLAVAIGGECVALHQPVERSGLGA